MKHLVLFLLVLTGAYAYAQDSRGSLTGQVTDPTGAVIPKAQITVTSTDTGADHPCDLDCRRLLYRRRT